MSDRPGARVAHATYQHRSATLDLAIQVFAPTFQTYVRPHPQHAKKPVGHKFGSLIRSTNVVYQHDICLDQRGINRSAQGIALENQRDTDPRSPERARQRPSGCLDRERGM